MTSQSYVYSSMEPITEELYLPCIQHGWLEIPQNTWEMLDSSRLDFQPALLV